MSAPGKGPLGLEWFVARRYLASRKGRGFLSLITLIAIGGVAVGVMALLVVIGVMSGLQHDLQRKILGANPHGIVLKIGQDVRMDDWRQVVDRVDADPDVSAAAPFIYTEVGLSGGGDYAEGAVLRGVPADTVAAEISGLREHLVTGKMPFDSTDSGKPGIIIGSRLADRLGLYPGKLVTVTSFQNAKLTPTGYMPQLRRFEVTGIFETGLYQYDTKFTYTSLQAAQDLLGMGSAVTGVEFNVRDPWHAKTVADRLQKELDYPYKVDDWQDQNASLFSALKLEKLAMAVILLLIVLVAAFNIVSTLIMVVTDKTREIGILRSMGMPARAIQRIFMLQGTVIGLVGTVLGSTLGGVLAWLLARYQFISLPGDVYFVDHLPVELTPWDVAFIVAASLAIAFLATLYPSLQAAKLTPVEAIRHE